MKRIIICESGATKADWRVVEDGAQATRELSPGMNVSTMTMDAIYRLYYISCLLADSGNHRPLGVA